MQRQRADVEATGAEGLMALLQAGQGSWTLFLVLGGRDGYISFIGVHYILHCFLFLVLGGKSSFCKIYFE